MSDKKTNASQTSAPHYFNRELSWIEFNRRVLGEALDTANPLLERLRFLCIAASNFDEFFMVRVAGLKRQLITGNYTTDPSGMGPQAQIQEISRRTKEIIAVKYDCLLHDILPRLEEEGIQMRRPSQYSGAQRKHINELFEREIFPVLTPVRRERLEDAIPYSGNMRLHAAFLLRGPESGDGENSDELLAVVQIPRSLDRIIYLPDKGGRVTFTLLEHVVQSHGEELFPGYEIIENAVFRVTRDADFGVDEERDEDFVEAMEQVLERREFSEAVRLTINKDAGRLKEILSSSLSLGPEEVYEKREPLDLSNLMGLVNLPGFDQLRYESWPPMWPRMLPDDGNLWDAVRRKDIILHHPFESFEPIVRLLQDAAVDPAVLAIKMTLYRTSGQSPVVQALEQAAENGKQVTVVVELKARFDEQRNIGWAHRLARSGVIVVYGIARLKVHAKAMLIVRREESGIRRYVHMGTGNYNDRTAKLYTDLGYLTSRDDIAYEAGLFFNAITGYSAIPALSKIVMAPVGLKSRVIQLIERESMRAASGDEGLILGKMNSLADPDVIDALYAASQAGVRVSLCIRGICMLVPGVPGLSENITVVSVVDRFLEHSRAYLFRNGGNEEVYCASADWMPRNLERRVELMFPIEQAELRKEIRSILEGYLHDNVKAHVLLPDGSYVKRTPRAREERHQVQQALYRTAREFADAKEPGNRKEFDVRRKPPESSANGRQ